MSSSSVRGFAPAFLLVLLCGIAGTAGAQQPSQAQIDAIRQNCRSDYQSYCASVPTGGTASLQCLRQHQADLSPSCRTAVVATEGGSTTRPPAAASRPMPPEMTPREEAALMRRACGADFRAWCRGVPLGGGRALACLAHNQAHLSPGCKTALAEAHSAR